RDAGEPHSRNAAGRRPHGERRDVGDHSPAAGAYTLRLEQKPGRSRSFDRLLHHRRGLRSKPQSYSRQGQPGNAGAERGRHRLLTPRRPHLHGVPHEQAAVGSAGHKRRPFGFGVGRSAVKSPLQTLIQMGVVPPVTFPTDSRYYGSATLTYTTP